MRERGVIGLSWLAALVAVFAQAAPAGAFYWYGWPGSGIPPERSIVGFPLVGPQHKDWQPPPIEVPVGPTSGGGPIIPPPQSTPEPATALAAIIGLGALAATRAIAGKKWKKTLAEPRAE
jgi:hypothetical protein